MIRFQINPTTTINSRESAKRYLYKQIPHYQSKPSAKCFLKTVTTKVNTLRYISSCNSLFKDKGSDTRNDIKTLSKNNDENDSGFTYSAKATPAMTSEEKAEELWKEGPYPHNVNFEATEAKYSFRPPGDVANQCIVLFPGQGTQYVGMGRDLLDLPDVQNMYDAASAILGFNLLEVSLNGPEHVLERTQVQQPAVFVASIAAAELARQRKPEILANCIGVAGFSVGEITALTFAGVFSFEDAVHLIKVRAEAMQTASEHIQGGMMTVFYDHKCRLGAVCETALEYCKSINVALPECRIASYLGPHCKVVGGSEEALEFIERYQKDFFITRLKRLKVSGAFHTSHMSPAAEHLKEILTKITVRDPQLPVHSNVTARPYVNAREITRMLPRQLYSPVKWEQTMNSLYWREVDQPYPQTFECGPGKSLKVIVKMSNAKAASHVTNFEA